MTKPPRPPRANPRRKGRPPLPKHIKKTHMKVAERRPKVMDLRLQGYTPEVIAHKLGILPSVVYADLKVLMSAAQAQNAEKDEMRAMMSLQLSYLWHALQVAVKEGDVKAISVALKILERTAKLHGLDADTRASVTVSAGNMDWDAILSAPASGGALGFDNSNN